MQAFYAEAVSISKQNVEVVRRLFELAEEGLRRGDPGAAFDDFVREGVVASNLQGRTPAVAGFDDLVGRAGYVELMRRWTEDFDDFWMEAEEIIDIDDDRVVATVRHYGTGKGSGVAVEMHMAAIYTFGAGRIVRVDMFPDRNHALRAVGLRE
jgi:ketosteroid isomerase-like protein